MRYTWLLLSWVIVGLAPRAFGHGMPLHIVGAGGTLTASLGLPLGPGFTDLAFDPSEDSRLDFPGATVRTDGPGFDVTGIGSGGSLQLEILSRLDATDGAKRRRWLWYWDPSAEAVVEAAGDPDFLIRRKDLLGSLTLDQFSGASASVLTVTDSLVENSHEHYLRYEVDNSPAAALGVYGVFARVAAPGFAPTQPVLLAFGYGVDDEQYAAGASAINAAASLPGDYDADGDADGADFLAWQRGYGSTTNLAADGSLNKEVDAADLTVWARDFSHSITLPGGSIAVPEPGGICLAVALLAFAAGKNWNQLRTLSR